MKQLTIIILIMGFLGCFSKKGNKSKEIENQQKVEVIENKSKGVSYDEQIKILNSLGYKFNEGVNKKMVLRDASEWVWDGDVEQKIEQNPFSILYFILGYGNVEIPKNNYSDNCIMFDLEWFAPNSQYKTFMERMGIITNGEINFSNIEVSVDSDKCEWISFEVNGIPKKWKLEKEGYIADHFIQRFSYLPSQLNVSGKYTYYDDGGQSFIIDFATEKEQNEFNVKTGLNREWLGEDNHFREPEK